MEQAAIALYADGLSRQTIAERLHLSKHSVSHLLTSVKDKLHAATLGQAAALYKRGLEDER